MARVATPTKTTTTALSSPAAKTSTVGSSSEDWNHGVGVVVEDLYSGHKVVAYPMNSVESSSSNHSGGSSGSSSNSHHHHDNNSHFRGRAPVRGPIIATKNTTNDNNSKNTTYPYPPSTQSFQPPQRVCRSLSAGRSTSARRGTDLVQDVYDRLGVQRDFGHPQQQQHNVLFPQQQQQQQQQQQASHHDDDDDDDEQRGRRMSDESPLRSRSLSRVRRAVDMTQRWGLPENNNNNNNEASPTKRSYRINVVTNQGSNKTQQQHSQPTHEQQQRTQYQQRLAELRVQIPSWNDEKKDGDGSFSLAHEDILRVTPPSVQDCINVYEKPIKPQKQKSFTRNVDPQYVAEFATRERKPKIDIYAEQRRQPPRRHGSVEDANTGSDQEGHQQQEQVGAPGGDAAMEPAMLRQRNAKKTSSNSKNTTAATAGGSIPSDMNGMIVGPGAAKRASKSSSNQQQQNSNSNNKGNVANAFLAAIQQPCKIQTNNTITTTSAAPIAEVQTPVGGLLDSPSVAISSMSGEDFAGFGGRPLNQQQQQKPSDPQQPRNRDRVQAYHQTSGSGNDNNNNNTAAAGKNKNHSNTKSNSKNNTNAATSDMIERMVEERLQTHILALEAKMENQMRIFMQQVEEKVMLRLQNMQDQINATEENQHHPYGHGNNATTTMYGTNNNKASGRPR